MKYVLFSDIHGNSYAFEAMMKKLAGEKIEGYFFCGDIADYYYHTIENIKKIKQLPNFYAVRGNHDALLLDAFGSDEKKHFAIRQYGNAYRYLNGEVADYIKPLPESMTVKIAGCNIMLIHGSPENHLNGRIYPDTPMDTETLNCDYLFLGHTHYQMIRVLKNCKIVNPGSLGQPRDGKGFSYYMIDFSTGKIEAQRVSFDLSPLFSEISVKDSENKYLFEVLKRNGGEFH
jgi:putative phosphoesterase